MAYLRSRQSHLSLLVWKAENSLSGKECVRNKTNGNCFLELISGIEQSSILGTLLFNIFLNVIFLFVKKASLHNHADDNTLSAFATDIDDLIEILPDTSQKTIDRMKLSQMIVNTKKFQALFTSKINMRYPQT